MMVFNFFFTRRFRWLAILSLILISLAILGIFSYQATTHTLTDAVKARRLPIARLAQQNLIEQFSQLTALNRRFAVSNTYRQAVMNKEWDETTNRLLSVPDEFPYIEGVFITNEANILQVDVGRGGWEIGTDLGKEKWFQAILADHMVSISNVYRTSVSENSPPHNAIAVLSPIYSGGSDKQIVGWFGFRVPTTEINKTLSSVTIGNRGFVYVTDALGNLVSNPHYNTVSDTTNFSPVPAVQNAINGGIGIDESYNPIEKERQLAAYIGDTKYHWAIVAAQPTTEAYAERTNLQNFIKVIYGLLLLIILCAGMTVLYLTRRLSLVNIIARQQAARNTAIFASIGDGLIVVNEYGNIIEVNPAASKLLGFTKQELRNKWFPGAIKIVDDQGRDISATVRPVLRSLETGKPVSTRAYYVTKSGKRLPVFVTAAPFIVNNRPVGAINMFQDRTEEMKIERAKDEFVSIASHQLRTPLTAMRLFTEMLMDGNVGELLPKQKDYLHKVEQSTDRMIKLVADILNVSRLELGRLKIRPVPTDLIALTKTYIDDIKPIASEKHVKITLWSSNNDWAQIPLDPTLMGQIIHNLLSNAVHYTSPKNGTVEVSLTQKSGKITMSVKDNGIGIPTEFKARIFQRFGRADNAVAVESQGTGLGLYLIKMIVDAAGGTVTFRSKQTVGTTFFVTFPISGMVGHVGEKV